MLQLPFVQDNVEEQRAIGEKVRQQIDALNSRIEEEREQTVSTVFYVGYCRRNSKVGRCRPELSAKRDMSGSLANISEYSAGWGQVFRNPFQP